MFSNKKLKRETGKEFMYNQGMMLGNYVLENSMAYFTELRSSTDYLK